MGIFKNFSASTTWVIRILWVLIAVDAIAVVSGYFEFQLLVDIGNGTGSLDYDVSAAADSNDNLPMHRMVFPAYDQCIKASHVFNLLDARGVISVTERQSYILRVRNLAKACGEAFLMTHAGGLAA